MNIKTLTSAIAVVIGATITLSACGSTSAGRRDVTFDRHINGRGPQSTSNGGSAAVVAAGTDRPSARSAFASSLR